MSVTPLRPHVRFYCSECDVHFHEHEREQHENCAVFENCENCGRQYSPGEDECPMCPKGAA